VPAVSADHPLASSTINSIISFLLNQTSQTISRLGANLSMQKLEANVARGPPDPWQMALPIHTPWL